MPKDPRAEFMRKSNLMAAGHIVHDSFEIEEKKLDLADPRQRFMRDSMALAEGMGMAGVRKLHADDAQKPQDPRERFIRDSQALANGATMTGVRKLHTDELEAQKPQDPREQFIQGWRKVADGESATRVFRADSAGALRKQREDKGGHLFPDPPYSIEEKDEVAKLIEELEIAKHNANDFRPGVIIDLRKIRHGK